VLRSQATSRSGCNPIIKQNELLALLDATEPTQDAEVAHALLEAKASNHQRMQGRTNVFDAELVQELAALLTRLARELAEARAKLPQAQPPLLWVKLLLHYDAGGVSVEVAPDQPCFPKEPTPRPTKSASALRH
jgi:hypothetical protein